MANAFEFLHILPRGPKPREKGITFTGDRGRTLAGIEDLMKCCGEFVDLIKLSMLSSRLQDRELVKEKIALYQSHQVDCFPGGMVLELSVLQQRVPEFFEEARDLGFNAVEVSATDTTIPHSSHLRLVETARKEYEFKVLAELGRHFEEEPLHVGRTIDEAKALLEAGAWKVIIEGAVVSASSGDEGHRLIQVAGAVGVENLIFEGGDHRWLIKTFGPDLNVGNAGDSNQVWYLELMRRGISPRLWYGEVGVFE